MRITCFLVRPFGSGSGSLEVFGALVRARGGLGTMAPEPQPGPGEQGDDNV